MHLRLDLCHVKSISVFPPWWPAAERCTVCDVVGLGKESRWAREPGAKGGVDRMEYEREEVKELAEVMHYTG